MPSMDTLTYKRIFGAEPITDDMRQMLEDLETVEPLAKRKFVIHFLDSRKWIEWNSFNEEKRSRR